MEPNNENLSHIVDDQINGKYEATNKNLLERMSHGEE